MQCIKSCRYGSGASVNVRINHQNGSQHWNYRPSETPCWWRRSTENLIVEYNLTLHNTSNLETDGLQQQKTTTTSGPTSISRHCQPRTERWGCIGHRRTKTGVEDWKNVTWSCESFDFCWGIQMVGSEFGGNSMNPWSQPALCQQCNGAGNFHSTLWAS